MGIDAELLVRVRTKECPSDEQIARWSWNLAQAVGAEKFFLQDGLPHEEYVGKSNEWHAAFKAHPRKADFDRTEGDTRFAIHKEIREQIGEPPQERRRALALTKSDAPRLQPGKVWYQDGDDILAGEDEWFLRVSLLTRYYGVGYERGDLLTICATAEWCELNIPDCEIWYGGDSSGVLAEPFGATERYELKKHMYSTSGRDYYANFDRTDFPTPGPCSLCIPGEPQFNRHGWGKDYVRVNCDGCGKSFVSHDNGKTWATQEDKN